MNEEAIFATALNKHTPEQRAAFLDGVCAADPALRDSVESLLRAHEEAGDFLHAPLLAVDATLQLPPISERPGTMIGRYKLLQQIGEGGFGVVYMAEQQEPVHRKVALKIIKPGMDTKEVIARFEAERQALALMDHPNIAHVLDAGATDSGRPYFVMELVRGVSITDYCDQNNLPPGDRLELFVSICQAVQHAHQKGIIHRDVKPSNVLVTLHDGRPVVKVIDFGVAKAINRRLTEQTLFTRYSEMIGTPLYMSPEQAEMSGLDVDTRTDIYSLGVLLYELLTGSTPFDKERLGRAAYDEIRRIIREEEPPKPSTRVSTLGGRATAVSEHRKTEPKKLSALLKGDLDWIVMKALEKDRTRRYETAKDFCDDIHHYLADRPVEARAPSTLYRLRKLVRRYRMAAATIVFAATTLIAATIFSSWMAIREVQARQQTVREKEATELARQHAEREADKARQAQEIAQREAARAEQEADKAGKAKVDAEMALDMMGAALGTARSPNEVGPEQTIAATLQNLVSRLDANVERNEYIEANLRPLIGKAYRDAGDHTAAATQLLRAADAQRTVFGELSPKLADTLIFLAASEIAISKPADAEKHLQESISICKARGGSEGARGQARTLNELVSALLSQGKTQEALEAAERSLAVLREYPGDVRDEIGIALLRLADCHGAQGRPEQKIADLREALGIFEQTDYLDGLWHGWTMLGQVFMSQQEWPAAKDALSRSLQLSEKFGVARVEMRHQTAARLSEVHAQQKDWHAAEVVHRQFLELTEPQVDRKDARLAFHRAQLIWSLLAQGKDQEAQAVREEYLVSATPEETWQFWMDFGDRMRTEGRLFEAQEALTQALQLAEGLGEKRIDCLHNSTWRLFGVLDDLRAWQAGESLCRQVLQVVEKEVPESDPRVIGERCLLADALRRQDKLSEAQAIWRDLLPIVRRATEAGDIIFWDLTDRLLCAELISLTTDERPTLDEAKRKLETLKGRVNREADWVAAYWHGVYSYIEDKLGRRPEAIDHVRICLQKNRPIATLADLWFVQTRFLRLLRDANRLAEAEDILRQAVAEKSQKLGDEHIITHFARLDLAELLMTRENYAEASALAERARDGLAAENRTSRVQQERAMRLLVQVYTAWQKPEAVSRWQAALDVLSGTQAAGGEQLGTKLTDGD